MKKFCKSYGTNVCYIETRDWSTIKECAKFINPALLEELSYKEKHCDPFTGYILVTKPDCIQAIKDTKWIPSEDELDYTDWNVLEAMIARDDINNRILNDIFVNMKDDEYVLTQDYANFLAGLYYAVDDKILKDYIYEAQKPKEARREDIKELEKCLNLQFSNYYYSILEYSYIRRREDKESQGIIRSIFNSIVDKTRKRTRNK